MYKDRVLKYPGSKWKIADWILAHMPEHTTYLEPFFGSGAVFFRKRPSEIETINDLDEEVVNLFRVIREHPIELARLLDNTAYARQTYENAFQSSEDPIEEARRFLVRCWMAIGTKIGVKTGWRSLISPNGSKVTKEWSVLPERILSVSARLKMAQIENQPAERLIERYRRREVLIYADPPYLSNTRTNRHYEFEMSEADHKRLLELLCNHPGPVVISGYDHPLYDEKLKEWHRDAIGVAAENGAKRTEVLWVNGTVKRMANQPSLFFFPARA